MNVYSQRYIPISETEEYKSFSTDFHYCICFFQNLSELIFYNGRIISFITTKSIYYLDTRIIDSVIQTLESIKLCCSIGSFTDANNLVRKFRDDLILYIYILEVINRRKPFVEEDLKKVDLRDIKEFAAFFLDIRLNSILTEDEMAIEAWFSNGVSNLPSNLKKKLSFENYMKFLNQNENINKIIVNYNLQSYWEKLRNKLNSYVHNNGREFTSQNLIQACDKNLEVFFKNVNIRISCISSFFVVLILMVDSSLICSTELIDYLDSGIDPPRECEYLVADFVQEFINVKVSKLHPELKTYLRDNNSCGMKID